MEKKRKWQKINVGIENTELRKGQTEENRKNEKIVRDIDRRKNRGQDRQK